MNSSKLFLTVLIASGIAFGSSPSLSAQDSGCRPAELTVQAGPESITVTGGMPGNQVGIMIGVNLACYTVLGAKIRLDPLMMLAMGEFDEEGKFTYEFKDDIGYPDPLSVYAQAIGFICHELVTSGLFEISYDGEGHYSVGFIVEEPVAIATDVPASSLTATRRDRCVA